LTTMPLSSGASWIAAPIASSHGQRSSSVNGFPVDIFSTFERGWNSSASRNGTPRRAASASPTVDLPLPETPIITMAGPDAIFGLASDMDRLEPRGHRRLAHRFRHGRVGMRRAGEVLGRAAELHQHRRFLDQLAGGSPKDVNAEHAVARFVSKDLHKAFGAVHGAGAGIGG